MLLPTLLTHKVEGGKQCGRRNTPGGEDIGGPGDKTAEQSVSDVLGSTCTSQGGGEVSFLLHPILIFGICG
jgi:hypothetical protein